MSKLYVLVFLMMLIAYLSPKEEYRKYFQFLIGAIMALLIITPAIRWISADDLKSDILDWSSTKNKIESIYYEPKQEAIIFDYVDEFENQRQTEELEME